MHLTPDLLDALRDHTLPAQTIEELALDHLAAVCEQCERRIRDARKRPPEPLFPKLAEILTGRRPTAKEVAQVKRQRASLRRLSSQAQRLARIERSISRFRSPLLVALFLAEARARVTDDPDEAFALTELAVAVSGQGQAAVTPGCLPLALAYAGNARRAAGELTEAEDYFGRVREAFHRQPNVSLWVRGELASLDGSLLKDQRNFRAAKDALQAALHDFKAVGDPPGTVRVLMNLAAVHRLAGAHPQALTTLREALDLIDAHVSPFLHLRAVHNMALYLCEDGRPELARRVLELLAPLYQRFPETRTRARWLGGVVARDLGELADAEASLRRTLAEFQDQRSPSYAALVALDLAETLLLDGRAAEVAPITAALPPLFRRQEVHREATAAVLLFHRAASELTLTRELVGRLRDFLERARVDSSLRFSDST